MDKQVVQEATLLLVALLFREGGNLKMQQTMHIHLTQSDSEMFFLVVLEHLDGIVKSLTHHSASAAVPKDKWILTVLQLSCEGHFEPNQRVLREQPSNSTTVNLLDELAKHFQHLCNQAHAEVARGHTPELKELLDTTQLFAVLILEVIQGPCEGNQEHFAQSTPLLETLNRVMRLSPVDIDQDGCGSQVESLKLSALKICKAVLEGQKKPSPIYERMLSILHLEVLQMQVEPPRPELENLEGSIEHVEAMLVQEEAQAVKALRPVQAESLVLLQMLTSYNPTLKEEIQFSQGVRTKLGSEVSSVEVWWQNALHERFFRVSFWLRCLRFFPVKLRAFVCV